MSRQEQRFLDWCNAGPVWRALVFWVVMIASLAVAGLFFIHLPDWWQGAVWGACLMYLWRDSRWQRAVVVLFVFVATIDLIRRLA